MLDRTFAAFSAHNAPSHTLKCEVQLEIDDKDLVFLIYHCFLTVHNWQKWKSIFLTCPCHITYRVEAVGLKSSNYTFRKYDFSEYKKFEAISFKIWYYFCQ